MEREYETLMNILNQWNGVHIKLSPVVTILLGPRSMPWTEEIIPGHTMGIRITALQIECWGFFDINITLLNALTRKLWDG